MLSCLIMHFRKKEKLRFLPKAKLRMIIKSHGYVHDGVDRFIMCFKTHELTQSKQNSTKSRLLFTQKYSEANLIIF